MKKITTALLIVLFTVPASRPEEGGGEIPNKISSLQTELLSLKRESPDIPAAEINKASEWIKDAKRKFESGNAELASILVEKISSQIQFLRATALESKSRDEIDKLNETLDKIRNQIEEIKIVNAELTQEISLFEQK